MHWKTSMTSGLRMAATLGMAGTLLTASGGTVAADAGHPPGIVGTWLMQVTRRDCTTDAPIGSVTSLVTYHHRGTISESPGNTGFAPGQRSDALGVWTREDGGTYRQRMIALINSDTPPNLPGTPTFDPARPISPGFFAGWQTIRHVAELVDADHLTSAGTNAFFKATGEQYRTGCSTATGVRFE